MKKFRLLISWTFLTGILTLKGLGQDAKPELSLNLGYFNSNDRLQYLQASAKTKVKGKFQPVSGVPVQFYITDEQAAHSLGKAVTNQKGIATVFIPSSAKDEWLKSESHQFLAITEATASNAATKATVELTRSKIRIDTGEGRKFMATFLALKHGEWVPVGGVDLVLAIKRLDGDLRVDQNPTHTTDSLGVASADFALAEIPGDTAGNVTLIAKVEDNDLYGNLTSERIVPWGIPTRYTTDFDKRSLYARRGHSPFWLEFMAYSIGIAVWAVLLYLFFQIRQIKRLGAL